MLQLSLRPSFAAGIRHLPGICAMRIGTLVKHSVRALLGAALALCLINSSLADDTVLRRVISSGVLKVAMSVDQPPFTMRARDNTVIGFDVDLAGALAGANGARLEIVELPFPELLSALVADKVDLVISGLTITPERTTQVSFVGPYTLSGKSILTTARIRAVAKDGSQFNDPETRLVALAGSTSESFAQRQLPRASLQTIRNYDEGIQQLLTGEVDALVADLPILRLTLLRYPDAGLGIVEPPLAIEPIGIALSRTDARFQNLVRNYLSALEQTGLLQRLHEKWFQDDGWVALLP